MIKYRIDELENRNNVYILCKTPSEWYKLKNIFENKKLTFSYHGEAYYNFSLNRWFKKTVKLPIIDISESNLYITYNQISFRRFIGYKAPYDLFGGIIKKGYVFDRKTDNKIFVSGFRNYGLPIEIVNQWQAEYRKVTLNYPTINKIKTIRVNRNDDNQIKCGSLILKVDELKNLHKTLHNSPIKSLQLTNNLKITLDELEEIVNYYSYVEK